MRNLSDSNLSDFAIGAIIDVKICQLQKLN